MVAQTAWDGATFLVCLAGFVYLERLRRVFKGGLVAGSFAYFIAAAAFFTAVYAFRLALDFLGYPANLPFSVRDFVVILGIALLALGLRKAALVLPKP